MDNTNILSANESFISNIFEDAGITEQPAVNQRRVDKVIERAMHEKLIADTSTFIFKGFPAAADGIISLANNKVGNDDSDYRA
ncbi:MAG: hypothetical protein ACSHX0_11010 [Akkermansiaceae bacterium]